MMNKKLYLIILCVFITTFLVPNCIAEIKEFSQEINVSIKGNTLKIKGVNLAYEKDLSISGGNVTDFEKTLTDSWYKNVTCEFNLNMDRTNSLLETLQGKIGNMSQDCSDFKTAGLNYYTLYSQCYANLTSCNEYRASNEGYMSRYEGCSQQSLNKDSQIMMCRNSLLSMNSTVEKAQEDLSNETGWRWLSTLAAIICIVIAFVSWQKYRKPFGKRAEDPTTKDSRGLNPK